MGCAVRYLSTRTSASRVPALEHRQFFTALEIEESFRGLVSWKEGKGIHRFGFRAFFLFSFFVVACLLDYGRVAPGLRYSYSNILLPGWTLLEAGGRKKESS